MAYYQSNRIKLRITAQLFSNFLTLLSKIGQILANFLNSVYSAYAYYPARKLLLVILNQTGAKTALSAFLQYLNYTLANLIIINIS